MKTLIWTALALAVSSAALAQTAKDAPEPPSGKWIADFGDNSCVLSRAYGASASEKILMFRPMPGDVYLQMALVTPFSGEAYARTGQMTLTLRPNGQKAVAPYRDYSLAGGHRMIDFSVFRSDLAKLPAATAMELTFVNDPPPPGARAKMPKAENPAPVRLALLSAEAAMKKIGECEDMVLKKWGFDPAALRTIKQQAEPVGAFAKWITMTADYPAAALSKREAGIVRFHYRVDAAGAVKDCGIFQSSGSAELDATTCKLMIERGRFKPAKGADGKPVESVRDDMVTWVPPAAGAKH